MSEKSAVITVINHIKKLGDAAHHQRFEDSLTPGIPDLNVCYNGVETWVEAKFLDDWPARPATGVRVPLRPEQVLWAALGVRSGRRVKCLLRVAGADPLWLVFDRRDVDFKELRDGKFNKVELLAKAARYGKQLDLTGVI